jgi:hypothetical protein
VQTIPQKFSRACSKCSVFLRILTSRFHHGTQNTCNIRSKRNSLRRVPQMLHRTSVVFVWQPQASHVQRPSPAAGSKPSWPSMRWERRCHKKKLRDYFLVVVRWEFVVRCSWCDFSLRNPGFLRAPPLQKTSKIEKRTVLDSLLLHLPSLEEIDMLSEHITNLFMRRLLAEAIGYIVTCIIKGEP